MRCVRWENKRKDFCHYIEWRDDGAHSLIQFKTDKGLVKFGGGKLSNHA